MRYYARRAFSNPAKIREFLSGVAVTGEADICDEVLIAIRRVVRAIDLHSRSLIASHGLTGPQALLLKEINKAQQISAGEIARRVTLSQATVTDIVNRLEKKGLVRKIRCQGDRRKLSISTTSAAQELLRKSPPLLQERFVARFSNLHDWEQTQLLSSLQRIASMMDAEDIDAAPVLSSGAVTATADNISADIGNPATTSD